MKRLFWILLVSALMLMVPALATAGERQRAHNDGSQHYASSSSHYEYGGHSRYEQRHGKGHKNGHGAHYARHEQRHPYKGFYDRKHSYERPAHYHGGHQHGQQPCRENHRTRVVGKVVAVPVIPLPLTQHLALHFSW